MYNNIYFKKRQNSIINLIETVKRNSCKYLILYCEFW